MLWWSKELGYYHIQQEQCWVEATFSQFPILPLFDPIQGIMRDPHGASVTFFKERQLLLPAIFKHRNHWCTGSGYSLPHWWLNRIHPATRRFVIAKWVLIFLSDQITFELCTNIPCWVMLRSTILWTKSKIAMIHSQTFHVNYLHTLPSHTS